MKYRDPITGNFKEIFIKVSDTLPVGAICQYAGSTAPSGYLMCNGAAVSRTTYADLFKAIGTAFGTGDGVTTFNLPNFNGKVPVGLDGTDTDFDTIGETGGSKYLQEHKHTTAIDTGGNQELDTYDTYKYITTARYYNVTSGVIDVQTGNSGNLQPYIVTNFIIKASKKVALDKGNVVDSLDGSDTDSAPSVRAVKEAFKTKGQVLFNNANGISDNITLSDSVENYDYINIFYSNSTSNDFNTKIIYTPNNKSIDFMTNDVGAGYITFILGKYTILNNTITHIYSGAFNARASGITDYSTAPVAGNIKIYKVIGYKS